MSATVPRDHGTQEPIRRRRTRQVAVGPVLVGGDAPVSVQSMTSTPTRDPEVTLAQIERLHRAGCEIVRVAVPDRVAIAGFAEIVRSSPIPIVADIQFSSELAVAAIEAGAAKVRINPGNIGGRDRIRRVADAARAAGIPIRVGSNAGSLSDETLRRHGGPTARALAESALEQVITLEELGFGDIVVAVKASDPLRTVEACRLVAMETDCPLHLGVTEAGLPIPGTARSAVAMGLLLAEGIGDTIRVSLTADPVLEVRAGWEILRAAGVRRRGPEIIACPTCSRCEVDLVGLVEQVAESLAECDLDCRIAVMGCIVNGPGEAREADVALCAERGGAVISRSGRALRRVPEDHMLEELLAEVERLRGEQSGEGREPQ